MTDTAEQSDPDAAIASIEQLDTPSNGDRREPLSQAIASRLRDAIIDGRLPPGMAIRQETLAMHLGTSRIPVREALRRLETEGMLTLVPHSGARVARLDLVEHVELYRIREALEPLAIAESAPRLSDDQLQELRGIATLIEDSRHDPRAWIQHDRSFHLATYAAAPLPRLLRMIHGFWNTTQHCRRAHVNNFDERAYEIVHAEHRMILEALERHNPIDAEERQRSHIRRARVELTTNAERIQPWKI